jgi:hypothetical protein
LSDLSSSPFVSPQCELLNVVDSKECKVFDSLTSGIAAINGRRELDATQFVANDRSQIVRRKIIVSVVMGCRKRTSIPIPTYACGVFTEEKELRFALCSGQMEGDAQTELDLEDDRAAGEGANEAENEAEDSADEAEDKLDQCSDANAKNKLVRGGELCSRRCVDRSCLAFFMGFFCVLSRFGRIPCDGAGY